MSAGKTPGNAAIWYAPDGYDPGTKGINGRRVAGESFLRGFLRHSTAAEVVALAYGPTDETHFRSFAARAGVTRPVRTVRLDTPERIAPVDVVSYPGPNFAPELWRRAIYGGAAWAMCGITHTTATKPVMQSLFDLRSAPQMPWDAVICTSASVHASLSGQMDLTDDFLGRRFGGNMPPRPLLPVIPLGVHCDDFTPDRAAGAALRARLGIGAQDIACAIIARLVPHEKFDPLPIYLALAEAQRQAGRRFHLVLCGQFRDDYSRKVFDAGARALMPGVGYHILDGADAALRKATLSGADMFLFPIDNVQETFGLAPIEAMAAGLPVVVSDWDGMKDTVTPDVGFRIPTEVPHADLTSYLGHRFYGGTDSYIQYLSQLSALTRVHLGQMVRALVILAGDPGLRARMGQAGQARARALYDWRAVIPQHQALWAEQSAMLARARAAGQAPGPMNGALLPPAPAPGVFFAAYPSRTGPAAGARFRASGAALPGIAAMLALRDYIQLKRQIEAAPRIEALQAAIVAAGPLGATVEDLARAVAMPVRGVQRLMLWLLKYGYAEEAE